MPAAFRRREKVRTGRVERQTRQRATAVLAWKAAAASAWSLLVAGLLASSVAAAPGSAVSAEAVANTSRTDDSPVLLFGGCGGVYFLAEPGELKVEVFKRDLNRRGLPTELRAILVGPDRRVLDEKRIPDDGRRRGSGPGPLRSVVLSARMEHKGVCALNVTVSNDRYGTDVVWGFRTNCPKYLVETARGHKDERHQEPIVLASPERPVDVCFWPRRGELSLEVTGVPSGVHELTLLDAKGRRLFSLPVDGQGKARATVGTDVPRQNLPWRLHLPKGRAVLHVDGLTRWTPQDLLPDSCLWSPSPDTWFPLLPYRWLLTPYRLKVYGQPGQSRSVSLRVHNNAATKQTIRLQVEFDGEPWPAQLSTSQVTLAPKRSKEVTLSCRVPPSGRRVCRVRATPVQQPDFTTYSTVTLIAGEAPAARPLQMPILLRPYSHENDQFGYLPNYPTEWEPYFDLENRPFIRTHRSLKVLRDGKWQDARSPDVPFYAGRSGTKVAFDRDNDVYTLTTSRGHAWLLHSTDGGRTFKAYDLGRSGGLDIEQFSGHNVPDGPPAVLRSVVRERDPKLRWRRLSDLELIVPEKRNGRLVIPEPVLLSRKALGVGSHSGVPSAVVSHGSRIHVVWGEATDPKEKVPGVPVYVVTYDRKERRLLGRPVLVGYGAPPNDVHNRPSITLDSRGYLHVLTGTHGRPFYYARSLKPNTAHEGWTPAEPLGPGLRQTYIGLVCGPDDTLHAVFRLWRTRVEPHPLATHATLAYQRKRPGQPWEPPRVLVVAAFSEYSVFYHRLTIDRRGRLFLSYDYWSTHWFYRNDHPGSRRALLLSPDGGDTWKLVGDDDWTD